MRTRRGCCGAPDSEKVNTMVDETNLRNYLLKCELQYRADHTEGADTLDWLAPYCGSTKEIADFLRSIGFRIARIVDEELWPGEKHQWVVTTSGVVVYAKSGGLFAKEVRT